MRSVPKLLESHPLIRLNHLFPRPGAHAPDCAKWTASCLGLSRIEASQQLVRSAAWRRKIRPAPKVSGAGPAKASHSAAASRPSTRILRRTGWRVSTAADQESAAISHAGLALYKHSSPAARSQFDLQPKANTAGDIAHCSSG